MNEDQNQLFVNSAFLADATVHFLNGFDFTTDFSYQRFKMSGQTNQAIPILSFSLSKSLLKNDKGV